jgi:hypothetical protein
LWPGILGQFGCEAACRRSARLVTPAKSRRINRSGSCDFHQDTLPVIETGAKLNLQREFLVNGPGPGGRTRRDRENTAVPRGMACRASLLNYRGKPRQAFVLIVFMKILPSWHDFRMGQREQRNRSAEK